MTSEKEVITHLGRAGQSGPIQLCHALGDPDDKDGWVEPHEAITRLKEETDFVEFRTGTSPYWLTVEGCREYERIHDHWPPAYK